MATSAFPCAHLGDCVPVRSRMPIEHWRRCSFCLGLCDLESAMATGQDRRLLENAQILLVLTSASRRGSHEHRSHGMTDYWGCCSADASLSMRCTLWGGLGCAFAHAMTHAEYNHTIACFHLKARSQRCFWCAFRSRRCNSTSRARVDPRLPRTRRPSDQISFRPCRALAGIRRIWQTRLECVTCAWSWYCHRHNDKSP